MSKPSPEATLLLQKYTNVKIAEQVVALEVEISGLKGELAGIALMESEGEGFATTIVRENEALQQENASLKQELLNERIDRLDALYAEDRITTDQYNIAIEELKMMKEALERAE